MDFADYIRRIYDASYWARDRIFAAAEGMSEDDYARANGLVYGSLRGILTHALASEVIWFNRCRGVETPQPDSPQRINETNLPTLDNLRERWMREERQIRTYLDSLSAAGLDDDVFYRRGDGQEFRQPVWQILTQVYGHGIQHRSEAAEALTMIGRSPGNLDFVIYLSETEG